MSPPNDRSADAAPFDLKGSLFTLTVLHLRRTDPAAIERHLAEKVAQAPGFFVNVPVVVDCEGLADADAALDLAGLIECLRRHGLVPVGVRNGSEALVAAAQAAGIGVLPEGRGSGRRAEPERAAAAAESERGSGAPSSRGNRLSTHPVRSGQQLYAPDGDLVLLGTVSPGAEVLADGNIHIYGPLRGRALAGAKGNAEARIFCLSLEAELVSIAGRYRVLEQTSSEFWGKPVQIHLADDHLIIEPLVR